ncbi:MAG: TolC family protein [Candidatus Eisenbacteria bacterium]
MAGAQRTRRGLGVVVLMLLGAGGGVLTEAGAVDVDTAGALNVDDCVAIALESSDVLSQARGGVQGAKGNYLASYAQVLPTIGTTASWSRDYQQYQRELAKLLGLEYSGEYSGSLSFHVTQSIFSLPGIQSLRATGKGFEAAREDYGAALSDVELTVRQQFYAYIGARRLAEVEERAVAVTREQLRRSETLFRLGSVARTDVLQAQVNLAEAEQAAVQRRNDLRLELARLALVMGLDPRRELEIDTLLADPGAPPEGELDAWVAVAIEQRDDLAAARARLRGAEISLSGARQERLPELGAYATWSRYARDPDEILLDGVSAEYNSSWMVSLQLSVNFFSGLMTEGHIEAAKGERVNRRAAVERMEKDIALEVREAFLDIFAEFENLESARTSVALARENLRLQQALYESGAGTLLEWDNARLSLRRAQVAEIQAEISRLLAHARFKRAIGT